jgi:glycine/D-amino acid oxidase-like deaminating enzyme
MAARPDVIIVGGGVLGAAILFELAQRGISGLLLERARFAGESTGKSAAIVRMHYSNRPVVRMALRSRELLRSFDELTGSEPVYFPTGWAFVVPDDMVAATCANAEMNRQEGVDVEEVSVDAIRPLFPGLRNDGIAAVFFEHLSGYADPAATVAGYLQAAQRLGAQARSHVAVTGLLTRGDDVVGVSTAAGDDIQADFVVLAAGAWSAKLAARVGVSFPLRTSREHELYLSTSEAAQPQAAMSNVVDRIYLRPMQEAGTRPQVLLGRGFPKEYEIVEPDGYDETVDRAFEEDARARLRQRLPQLAVGQRVGGAVGLYAITPDWHPYLGPVDGVRGLILATGGSGHGFKLGPAIGEMVAADIAGGSTDYANIEAFNLRRLESDQLFGAAIGGNRA